LWTKKDSNLRRLALQASALPTELLVHIKKGENNEAICKVQFTKYNKTICIFLNSNKQSIYF